MNRIERFKPWLVAGMLIATLALSGTARAAGLLTPTDGSLPPLAIRDHQVHVTIEDGFAVTRVEQVFHNSHDVDLEAIYSFPVPAHASVSEFTLWIDGKPVNAEVLEKHEARQAYEEEKAAGREAGITEKDEYKTFDVSVWPVRAGQDTRIRLVYLQPVTVDTGIGRYVYPLEEGGVDEQKLAFWKSETEVTGRFSFDLSLKSAYPVNAVRLPNQGQAAVTQQDAGHWSVHVDRGAAPGQAGPSGNISAQEGQTGPATPGSGTAPVYALDRDLVVYWRHAPNLPGSVDLVAYKAEPGKRGTFMLVVTPGDDLRPITQGRDWVFVLDVSGSMRGKYATLADGVQRALHKLRPDDRFRIVLFNNRAWELTHGFTPATPESVARAVQAVQSITPDSGTNLYAGLEQGLDTLDADRTSAVVLVTDGVANVGETRQRAFLDLIKRKDVRLFTFIMGNSANRPLLEALTRDSHGFAASISNADDMVGQLLLATDKVTHEALHGVEISIEGVKTADITPRTIGSLYRGQQLVVMGHYWGEGPADIQVRGRVSGQPKVYRTRFGFPSVATEDPEIERLWAYATVEDLRQDMEDFGEKADMKQAIIDLGTEYGLVTDYTSMVVMRSEAFAKRGIQRRNQTRVALEGAARAQRAQSAAVSHRVDTQQPMFTGNRATTGGGSGAVDPLQLALLLCVGLLVLSLRLPRNNGRALH